MLYSRALRCVGLIAIAAACVACGDVTGPTSTIAEPSRQVRPATPVDATFTRWILISGVWVLVEDVIAK